MGQNTGLTMHAPSYGGMGSASYGDVIRKYRTSLGISQQRLAGLVGTTRQTVTNWESGRALPDLHTVKKLCTILHMPVHEFFGIQPGAEPTMREKRLLEEYRCLSEVGRNVIDRMVSAMRKEEADAADRVLTESFTLIGRYPTAASAGPGNEFGDDNRPECCFVKKNRRNEKADAVIPVKGDSMEPVYHDGDLVYVAFTNAADDGSIVICTMADGAVIKKKLGDKLYSLNPDLPFGEKSESDHVQIIGIVTGTVMPEDLPSEDDAERLQELFADDVRKFWQKYALA